MGEDTFESSLCCVSETTVMCGLSGNVTSFLKLQNATVYRSSPIRSRHNESEKIVPLNTPIRIRSRDLIQDSLGKGPQPTALTHVRSNTVFMSLTHISAL